MVCADHLLAQPHCRRATKGVGSREAMTQLLSGHLLEMVGLETLNTSSAIKQTGISS